MQILALKSYLSLENLKKLVINVRIFVSIKKVLFYSFDANVRVNAPATTLSILNMKLYMNLVISDFKHLFSLKNIIS